jgi:translation initiation factor 3 subunit I
MSQLVVAGRGVDRDVRSSSRPQLIDAESLEVIKSYITTTPLNSAAILTDRSLVLLGGGQDAMNVTTTGARQGQFEVRFWHQVFEEELARVKGGFGPCNT